MSMGEADLLNWMEFLLQQHVLNRQKKLSYSTSSVLLTLWYFVYLPHWLWEDKSETVEGAWRDRGRTQRESHRECLLYTAGLDKRKAISQPYSSCLQIPLGWTPTRDSHEFHIWHLGSTQLTLEFGDRVEHTYISTVVGSTAPIILVQSFNFIIVLLHNRQHNHKLYFFLVFVTSSTASYPPNDIFK